MAITTRDRVRHLAAQVVKPRVSEGTWRRLRGRFRHDVAQPVDPLAGMNLNQLARYFRTDKWGTHRYTQHYARHLNQLRRREFTLLEIGIGGYSRSGDGGASLRMWRQYFPKAQIVGLDIEDKSFVAGDRIRVYQGSQADPAVLQRILDETGEITVVIDDGSHRPEHIRATFAYLFPRIADRGIYAIEDTQTSYWPRWGGSATLSEASTSMSMVKDLVDGLNYEEFPDDEYEPTYFDRHVRAVHAYHNLVILEKGRNEEGSFRRRRRRLLAEDDPDYVPAAPVAEQRRGLTPPADVPAPPPSITS